MLIKIVFLEKCMLPIQFQPYVMCNQTTTYRNLPKDSLGLTNAPNLNKLLCQAIYFFYSTQKLPPSYSFQILNEFYQDQTSKGEFEKCEFIISSSPSLILESEDTIVSSWAVIRALLSNTFVLRMHAGFLPFLPSPVTEYSMQCYEKLHSACWAAKARCFPSFCDEGVFRVAVDVFLQKQDQF